MRAAYLVAALALCGVAVEASSVTPVQKVMQLLNGLLKKAQDEASTEEKNYGEFKASLCADFIRDRGNAIQDLEQTISTSDAKAKDNQARADQLGNQIENDQKQVDDWEGDVKAATAVRTMDADDFNKDDEEYTRAIQAIKKAMEVLKAGVKNRAQMFLQKVADLPKVPAEVRSKLVSFLQPPEAEAYKAKSFGIIPMLEDLQNKFTNELNDMKNKEKDSQNAYDALSTDMTDRLKGHKDRIDKASSAKAEHESVVAHEKAQIALDKEAKGTNEEALKGRQATCEKTTQKYEARKKQREEEIEALSKAIEILKDGRLTTAGSTVRQFLQINSEAQVQVRKAASFLKLRSSALKSTILSAVAASAQDGPFDKVIGMVKDLISKLAQQSAEEAEHKKWCDNELYDNQGHRGKYTDSSCKLHTDIRVMDAEIQDMKDKIADLEKTMTEIDADRAKAVEVRTKAKTENEQVIADTKAGIEAVDSAMKVLEEYYKKAGQATDLIQDVVQDEKTKTDDRRDKARDFEQDKHEPQLYNSAFQGNQQSGTNIVGMMEVIISDFTREKEKAESDEKEQADDHDEFMEDSRKERNRTMRTKERTELAMQEKSQDKSVAEGELKDSQNLLKEALNYYDKLEPSCVASKFNYGDRVKQREEEIKSLEEALKILGADQ